MNQQASILTKSLDQLQSCPQGDPDSAPTDLVGRITVARQKPLVELTDEEIGCLISQGDGLPHILDLVFPKLDADPLYEGGYYPGDVLSILLRAPEDWWQGRPQYQARLPQLRERALARPEEEARSFRESLGNLR